MNEDSPLPRSSSILPVDQSGELDSHRSGSVSGASETTGSMPSSSNDVSREVKGSEEPAGIAQEENKNVFRLRLLVISVLVASTIGVAVGVFLYVSGAEQSDFESQFEDDADKVLESIGTTLALTLGSVDAFLVALVSYARDTNSTWPFVTYPDYGVRMAKLRTLSKAILASQYQLVTAEQRAEWEAYSVANDAWVQDGIDTQKIDKNFHGTIVTDFWTRGDIHDTGDPYYAPGPYLPKWQHAPVVPIYAPYNWDGMTYSALAGALPVLEGERKIALGDISNIADPTDPESIRTAAGNNVYIKDYVGTDKDETEPFSDIFFPILDYAADYVEIPRNVSASELGNVVGVFAMTFYWRDLIQNILPTDSNGIVVVFENSCGKSFSYQINGPETLYLGEGDLHDAKYDGYLVKSSNLVDLNALSYDDTYTGLELSRNGCSFTLHVYPSLDREDHYATSDPLVFTVVAVAIFAFTSLVFIFYDHNVERRQAKVMETAVHTNAIVTSLFPSNVRERLFNTEQSAEQKRKFEHNKTRLKTFLSDGKIDSLESAEAAAKQSPIADLFPHCTVLFSDISGFTAWSSVREPSQVFTLLETLYGAFDSIAIKRGVFKVETIGDAYVAVVGLPEARKDHAVVMAKFARDCLIRMLETVRDLETTLGPGTGDLRLRLGMHSGAVTAGVLRGQKSRFQLFGDTVNTASRMESTGVPNKIQASDSTAQLLIQAGKQAWVKAREELVVAKGKGSMKTFWIEPKLMGSMAMSSSDTSERMYSQLDERTARLIDWNTDILARLIRHICAKRLVTKASRVARSGTGTIPSAKKDTILEEVCEIIDLPDFNATYYLEHQDPDLVELDEEVSTQLHDFVVSIAALYNCNPFHCFDHASHVGMSTAKLLSRIVKPEEVLASKNRPEKDEEIGLSLHQHTFGITSDPLTQFACVFSALIHDLDHPGVPNSTLVQEKSPLATRYKDKSVAEQNSVDIAWTLFMSDSYEALRNTICDSPHELKRFRQLVVNIVMATDILDPDLKKLRNDRWDKAFSPEAGQETSPRDQLNRKATIVMEHLIQASDVAHTMQHWHIYQKWNEKLFKEMYNAYRAGRSAKDPSEFWYEGELSFLDNYVIPLAKKLRNCGVFGVSSDEYLNYALKNREEWAYRGRDVVAELVAKQRPLSNDR